jgi:hypothetical protein
MAGCGYAPHKDPSVHSFASRSEALRAAQNHANGVHGEVLEVVNPDGSMLPLIHAGDFLVSVDHGFTDDLLGKVNSYRPHWNHGALTTHRFVSGNARDGFIASGDHNAHSEAQERVHADVYVGDTIAVYTFAK